MTNDFLITFMLLGVLFMGMAGAFVGSFLIEKYYREKLRFFGKLAEELVLAADKMAKKLHELEEKG